MTANMRLTEIWRVKTRQGQTARAMLVPRGTELSLTWFVNDRLDGAEDFTDWAAALRRADALRLTYLAAR